MCPDQIHYDCTVVTGLEELATREIRRKIPNAECLKHTNGHVTFKCSDGFDSVSKLCSVDNIYTIILERDKLDLKNCDDEKKLEAILLPLLDECAWKTGLSVWKQANKFQDHDDDNDSQYNLKRMLDPNDDNSGVPSFRVSCNRTGEHKFTSPQVCCIFGGQINDRFHWKVSLKNFDLEILLTIKHNWLRVGVCLTKQSLYKRHIVSYGLTTLRGTIAYNLIQVAQIQPGDIVCDPLCGTGVIPVESAINWPETFVLAGDNHDVAIQKSDENLKANRLTKTDLLCWDTTRLPVKDGSIDVFITDLPFGKRMGSKHDNRCKYPRFMAEMIRCTRPSTGRIVLLTQDKFNANQTIHGALVKKYCRWERAFFVNMGGLDSSIYLLKRNAGQFETENEPK